jgi:hypothetical protein
MAKPNLKLDLKALKFNPQQVKEVGRKYGLVIVSGVVLIGAPLAAFVVSQGMSESLLADAQARASKHSDLDGLANSEMTLSIPGREPATFRGIINEGRIALYKARLAEVAQESVTSRKIALDHNSKGRSPSVSMRLAKGDPNEKGLPLQVFDSLEGQYAALLDRVGAGEPYPEQKIVEQLMRRRSQIVDAQFGAKGESELTPEERTLLGSLLSAERLGRYCEAARGISLYADAASIGAPDKSRRTTKAKPLDLFLMQWNYWVTDDILSALSGLNDKRDVVAAPVKRIISLSSTLQARGAPSTDAGGGGGAAGGEGAPAGDAAPPADGADPASSPSADSAATSASGQPVNPDAPLPAPDYTASLTGRVANQAFDVMFTEARLVVETDSIPMVMDALARRNFITVIDARIRPLDSFDAAEEGYIYGSKPVSLVVLKLESIWLREWTGQFMPDDLRARLGTTGLLAQSPSGAETLPDGDPTSPEAPPTDEPQG